jgi:hypothetical protein
MLYYLAKTAGFLTTVAFHYPYYTENTVFIQVLFFGILFHILKTLFRESGSFIRYIHFKASCSYAALAAIMEIIGVDTED